MPRQITTPMPKVSSELLTVRIHRSIKCQLGGFESVEFSEALECETPKSEYEDTRAWMEEEVMRRLVASAQSMLADVDLPVDGKSAAGQMAFKLKG